MTQLKTSNVQFSNGYVYNHILTKENSLYLPKKLASLISVVVLQCPQNLDS